MSPADTEYARWFRWLFLAGILLGSVPMILILVSLRFQPICFGASCATPAAQKSQALGSAALTIYVTEIPMTIVLLCIKWVRPMGYGLLIMLFVDPIVWVYSCFAALSPPPG
ncbi:MAG: hypothetical protein OJF49_003984 [Ktedonobacterales bacterium]|nr:MAG: hypothetical protein OJF49_003984 [Ktedonobacterales bacterium]